MKFRDLLRKKDLSMILTDGRADCHAGGSSSDADGLRRELGLTDLVAFGIAVIVGAGIFSTIGNAAYWGGPAVVFLCIFMGLACGCSALCYADFASRIPIAGSAYTYSYAAFGEVIAWVIGWDLIMEYTVAASAVSISWSDYFTSLISGYGIEFPRFLSMDYFSASKGVQKIGELLSQGHTLETIGRIPGMSFALSGYHAWNEAPLVFGIRPILDLPALCVVVLLTAVSYTGIRESKRITNGLVTIKTATVLLVIIAGAFYVRQENWSPFAPNGLPGVLKGVSGVFFAYIGFDAISNTAEECRNPQRDLPRGIIYSLLICTFLYVALALVLTGAVNYKDLRVGDPLVAAFSGNGANARMIAGIVAASAVVTMATVILALAISQSRVMMSMGRDGLLPSIFHAIHPRFGTPWFSTLFTGAVVIVPSQLMNLADVTDLCSIGTLFAFALVCGGVLVLEEDKSVSRGKFKVPYIDSRYIFTPALLVIASACCIFSPREAAVLWRYPHVIGFAAVSALLAYVSFRKRLSLIPLAGLEICLYLMTELGRTTWLGFSVWLVIGLGCYLAYGRKHSKLHRVRASRTAGVTKNN